jgi:pimeloyl-ACP methyl ester carboxylesterase
MSDSVDRQRRLVVGTVLSGVAAVELARTGNAFAQGVPSVPAARAPSSKRLEPLRHIDAGVLNVAYYDGGPVDGPVAILLHGFPYDIHCYVDVAPLLAPRGFRVIVPYLRGFGATRFRDEATLRSGEQAALGADVIALMDAIGIKRAVLAGHNWGGRAACVAAALWPERCAGLVTVNSYLIQDLARRNMKPHSGTNSIFRSSAGAPGSPPTGARSRGSYGKNGRRTGISTMPPSTGQRRRTTTPITSMS